MGSLQLVVSQTGGRFFKMTVLTKPLSSVQKKPEVDVPLTVDDELDYALRRSARIGRVANVCLMGTLVALLLLGIGVGVHSYKVFMRRNTYAGMCHLPLKEFFNDNTVIGASIKERMMRMDQYNRMAERQTQMVPEVKTTFELDFDIDVEEENYEVLELPEIFFGRYMHDLKENLTVIIDTQRSRCYIMDLDRTHVPPPKNMFDMILKMKQGFYNLDFQEIKKNYRVVGDEIPNLKGYGYLVPRACHNRRTYKLEELVGSEIVKRETGHMEKYGELLGSTVIQYHIEGLDD